MNAQQTGWRGPVVLLGLLVLSGCGPSEKRQAKEAFRRGVACAEEGEFHQAIVAFTEAIRLNPKDPKAYYHRGAAYDEMYASGLAIADFTRAIHLDPKYAEAYYYRHWIYEELGEFDQAEADLAKARQLGCAPK